ncbi:MAG: IscS subfamily cysteine desulfurase [Candidatus Paracaedimonas acanthamoebae]|uniref:Cysteine desulfurase IscS n=1 Tax=Candidatus Paracaedimonas acanthamoebae TaxID=244581 RepID=A0A8J7TV56_9PROT|nr:IscS subfamily cysteine desulfurase [Candidatus Paracaedimonas acanthamoebae]
MIYLDYQATTPCDPRVVEKMLPYFTEYFGNPHSRNHQFGWDAEAAVEIARHQVAEILGANPKEIIFTSGATESNNLALKGVAYFNQAEKNHIITTVTEHKCVLDTCRHLEQQGFDVTYLPVKENGLLDLKKLEEAITEKTALVSIMAVNNEIGVIQPLQEIGAICRKKNVYFHTDAAQAVGKIPLNVKEMNIDLLSLSSHKLYGPKGVGVLYVGRKPRVRLTSQMNGGGQERGMRSGTLSPALCVGLGEACRIAQEEMGTENTHLTQLNRYFLEKIEHSLDQVYLNGDRLQRIPGNLNLSFAHVEGEGLMMAIKNLAVSSGSACTSESLEPSYVLRALGVDEGLAHTSLRIGFGRFTTLQEVDKASEIIISAVRKLREMSPLWEMAQRGIDLKTINWAAH